MFRPGKSVAGVTGAYELDSADPKLRQKIEREAKPLDRLLQGARPAPFGGGRQLSLFRYDFASVVAYPLRITPLLSFIR